MTRRRLILAALVGALAAPTPTSAAGPAFEPAAAATGLDFVHFNGMTGELYFPEMTGQGGALLDYDGDGDLDVFFVQGTLLGPEETLDDALFPPVGPRPPTDRLYRNDLGRDADGRLVPRFVDVTAEAGLADPAGAGYGMGAAAGDVDGDGWTDLYVTRFGPNRLLRNRGDGTFEEVPGAGGADDPAWSVSAAFADLEGDGDLDLFVVDYVAFSVAENITCYASDSRRDYCGPTAYPAVPDRLYRNRGDGTFEDATAALLGPHAPGPGLGVVVDDFDGDGRLDVYVANDGAANHLWLQRPDGTFRDEAPLAGVAVNLQGAAEAGMGVAAGDYDGDGDPDLFLTHLTGETNTLYANQGGGLFADRTAASGLGPPSLPWTGFGTGWLDYDQDGWLDLVVLDGAVRLQEAATGPDPRYPLGQPALLFRNRGDGTFEETTAEGGAALARSVVGRGASLGDVDGDGDTDVLAFHNNGPAELLLNRAGDGRGWLGLRLAGGGGETATGPGEAGPGTFHTRVAVAVADRSPLHRTVRTDGSYASASDPRVVVGLGDGDARPLELRIAAPDGTTRRWLGPPAGRYLVVPVEPASPPPAASAEPSEPTEEPR